MKKLLPLLVAISLQAGSGVAHAADKYANLVEGFASWQAGRIERLILDETLREIADNRWIKRYFEKSAHSIVLYDSSSAYRLIPLLQHQIREDVQTFENLGQCIEDSAKYWLDSSINEELRAEHAIKAFEGLQVLTTDPRVIENAENADLTVSGLLAALDCAELADRSEKRVPLSEQLQLEARATLERSIEGLVEKATEILKERKDEIEFGFTIIPDTQAPGEDRKLPQKVVEAADALLRFLEVLEEYKGIGESQQTNVVKVHRMIVVLDYFGIVENDSKRIRTEDFNGFSKLKNISLFFASLADASENSPAAVEAVLQQFVDDKAVFQAKRSAPSYYSVYTKNKVNDGDLTREDKNVRCSRFVILPCENSLFLSSFYGLALNEIDDGSGDDEWSGRAYGPLGIEWKLLTYKGSPVSVNYAPVDVGNYITAELKGDDYDAEAEDIIAPSLFFAWSAARKPFSLIVGYQRDVKIETGETDDVAFVSVAFDLPIWVLY